MDDEPLRISLYRPSLAIEQLIHFDDAGTRRLREIVVLALRDATTDAMNSAIAESGSNVAPENAISSDGYYAGLVEGFVEAIYHDVAALLRSGVPIDALSSTLQDIKAATIGALEDLEFQLGNGRDPED